MSRLIRRIICDQCRKPILPGTPGTFFLIRRINVPNYSGNTIRELQKHELCSAEVFPSATHFVPRLSGYFNKNKDLSGHLWDSLA